MAQGNKMAKTEFFKLADRARDFIETYGSPKDIAYFNKIDKEIKRDKFASKKEKECRIQKRS